MSTHPNAILQLVLTPDDLARKTYRAILSDAGHSLDTGKLININRHDYFMQVMEKDYDDSHQIAAKSGDIVLWTFVTYGYGARVSWDKLETVKRELEIWAKTVCDKHRCSYEIFVSANYW